MSLEGARLDLTADLSIDVRGFMLGLQAAATARNGTRSGRADVRELAGALADAGLTARLYSPSQHIVTVGAGVDSTLGGLLLSTRKAQPDALGILRVSGRARAVETALAGALLLGIALVRAGDEPPEGSRR